METKFRMFTMGLWAGQCFEVQNPCTEEGSVGFTPLIAENGKVFYALTSDVEDMVPCPEGQMMAILAIERMEMQDW